MSAVDSNTLKEYSAKTTAQAFWNLFPALLVASLIPTLSGLINGLIIGNSFPPEAMAATSFVSPLAMVISAIASTFASGAGIIYGRYLGRGQAEDVHKVYTASFTSLLIIGIVLTTVGELFAEPIAGMIGAHGDTLQPTIDYLRGQFVGTIPSLIAPSLVTFLNLGNEARYGMLSSLVLAVCILVFGMLNVNVFHGGMMGMGIASSMAGFCTFAFLYAKFLKHPEFGHIVRDSKIAFETGNMVRLGAPVAVLQIGAAVRNMILNSMTASTGGVLAVAGLGIMSSSSGLLSAVNVALISVTSTLVSISAGEENKTSLYNLVNYLLKTGAVIFLSVAAVYCVAAPFLAALFGMNSDGGQIASSAIRFYCGEYLANWFCCILIGTYQSIGRSGLASLLQFLITCLYGIIVIYTGAAVAPEGYKVFGVWSCYGISQILGVVTIVLIAWIKSKHFPNSIEKLLWLDKDYGVPEKDRIVISVDSVDDVVTVARTVQEFLRDRNIDNRRSMDTALCLEEMAGNIISHGFTKSKKKKDLSVDIYVAVKNDEIMIRLKDNAPQFDPFSKLKQYRETVDDPMKNIGIRMVSGIAKEMRYQTTLGMNVLMIKM